MKFITLSEMTPEAFSIYMDAATVVAITNNVLGDLNRHLGSPENVAQFLQDEATRCQKPIAVNVPVSADKSITRLFGPEGWSLDRLSGWMATMKPSLEIAFGMVTDVTSI